MAYTATQTVGFEFAYNKAGHGANPVPYLLRPNVAFTKGMLVGIVGLTGGENRGMIFPWQAATQWDTTPVVGVMAETIAQADNPADGETWGLVYDNPLNVYRVTFIPNLNGTATIVVGANTNTTGMETDVAIGNNNRARGAMIYFYEGPLKGTLRLCNDSVAATDRLEWLKPTPVAPTVADKFYITGHAGLDTANACAYPGAVGVSVDNDSRRVLTNVALNAAEQPVKVLSMDPVNMTFNVAFQGMLFSR